MEKYDYLESVKNDILEYVKENKNNLQDEQFNFDALYDELFISDEVTGNASGSYYCNAWKAEESLCHNTDLLLEALDEFGYFDSIDNTNCSIRAIRNHGAEWCDVTIRCYLLGQALEEVKKEVKEIVFDEE